MPDLLDRMLQEAPKSPGGDMLDRMASEYEPPTVPDPIEEDAQIKEAVDISDDLGISLADADANYKQIADKPEKRPPSKAGFSFVAVTPSKWEKFKGFFTSKRNPLPPNADRIEKVTRAFDIGMGAPLRAFMKLSKGMTLGAPDLM